MLFLWIVPCSVKLLYFLIVSSVLINNLIQLWFCKRSWSHYSTEVLSRTEGLIWKSTWRSKFLKLLLVLLLRVLSIWVSQFFSWKSIFLFLSWFGIICLLKWSKTLLFHRRFSTTLVSLSLVRSLGMCWKVSWNRADWRRRIFSFLRQILRLVSFPWADSCYFFLWRFLFSHLFLILFVLIQWINSI